MVYLNFSWSSLTERYLCYKLSWTFRTKQKGHIIFPPKTMYHIKYFRIRHRHDNHMSKVKLKNEKKPWSLNLETHLYLSIKGNQKTTRKIKNMWPKKLVQTQIHVPTSVCSKNNYVNSCEVVNLLNGQVSTWLPNNRGFEAYKTHIAFVWEPPLKQIYNTHAHTCILQPHK